MKKRILLIGFLLLTSACNFGIPIPTFESPTVETLQTTPAPAATTQASPTASAPTFTAEIPSYYFTEEFDAATPHWKFLQTGGMDSPITALADNNLRIDISSPDTWLLGIHDVYDYSNIYIRAKFSASPSGSVGLVCRYNENNGWFEYNLASDGTYSVLLGQWLADGIAKYIPIVSADIRQFNAGTQTHEIGLSCQDSSLLLYLDDALIRNLDVSRYELPYGKIGISASSFREAPMTILIEWVRVGAE
ncbi:MAG: hypothetical protein C4557_00290 [Anaerolineaceae bacterium]|jgi:hypothetical protein|nr:MAG: hypothetical protein C4557_00290 [Anaerolineaceae bacterium]